MKALKQIGCGECHWMVIVAASGALAVGGATFKASSGELLTPVQMQERAQSVGIIHTYSPQAAICTSSGWMRGGGAVADFNRNGWPDIYIPGGSNFADALFINNGNGTFTNQAAAWGIDLWHCGSGVAAADFDNDGWIDLFVASPGNLDDGAPTPGRHKLLRNTGKESFVNVAEQAGVHVANNHHAAYGACWGDYNLNGHLDLYVSYWWSNPTLSDVLFRNNGDGTFTDVTVEAGVYDSSTYGFQASFADMNNNGWPDILLAADWGTSRYFRNNGNGTFTNLTPLNGTGIDSNGMGLTVGDFENNGLLDWYVTSIYPPHSPGFHPGNTLYRNLGGHQFEEIGAEAGAHDGRWGWGTIAVDLDQDGWIDIVEVNGRPSHPFLNDPPRVFYNKGNATFTEIAESAGMGNPDQGRAVMRIDAHRNGRQDLLIVPFNQPVLYYRNNTLSAGNWIVIDFDTSPHPLLAPDGYGTRVEVTTGELSQIRYVNGEPSYLATSELNAHFGLAEAEIIDTVTIHWPRGYVTTLQDVPVNQYMTVTAPQPADFNADGVVNVADMLQLFAHWGPLAPGDASVLKYDLNNDGVVNVVDLLLLLSSWG